MDALPANLLEMLRDYRGRLWFASMPAELWPASQLELETRRTNYVALHVCGAKVVSVVADGPVSPADRGFQLRSAKTAAPYLQCAALDPNLDRIEASESWQIHLARGTGVAEESAIYPPGGG